ncbi:unnamed protein product [Parajaminaea phylloscopi]
MLSVWSGRHDTERLRSGRCASSCLYMCSLPLLLDKACCVQIVPSVETSTMLSNVLGRARGSSDKHSDRERAQSGHQHISHPRPSFTMDASPPAAGMAGTPSQFSGSPGGSSSPSIPYNPSHWPTSPTTTGAANSSLPTRQDSLNSTTSLGSLKSRQPTAGPSTHPNSSFAPGGDRIASHSLLPEEMRAMQKERERERDAALNAEMSRQESAVSASSSTRTASSSKSPYSSNHMESSVTRLLVATKMLLEALTKWSAGQKTETQVSDVYVRLGNDFITARQAFASYNIDMSDLASVPDDLRVCLERCLSEDASPLVLEQHLPRVREIIIHLLQGLKVKQAEYKRILVSSQRASISSSKRQSSSADRPQRNSRLVRTDRQGVSEGAPNLQSVPEPLEPSPDAKAVPPQRSYSSGGPPAAVLASPEGHSPSANSPAGVTLQDEGVQPRASTGGSQSEMGDKAPLQSTPETPQVQLPEEKLGSADLQTQHALNLSPRSSSLGRVSGPISGGKLARSQSNIDVIPSQGDISDTDPSLRALKSRDALERRASKRFSAYTFNKMGVGQGFGQSFGSGNLGMSMLSMGAVGGSPVTERAHGHKRTGSRRQKHSITEMPIEEQPPLPNSSPYLASKKSPLVGQASDAEEVIASPTPVKKASRKSQPSGNGNLLSPHPRGARSPTPSQNAASSTESLPFLDAKQVPISPIRPESQAPSQAPARNKLATGLGLSGAAAMDRNEPSVSSTNEDIDQDDGKRRSTLNVFLQLGGQTRKSSLDTTQEIGIARLRMLFVDRFAYSPGKDDFPPIYIKDVNSGVAYELEDLNDVTDNCVLTLNIEPLDQVKQHLDLSLGAITRELRELKSSLADRDRGLLAATAAATTASGRPSLASPNFADVSFSVPLASPSKFSAQEFAAAGQRMANARLQPDGASHSALDSTGSDMDGSNGSAESGARMAQELRAHYDEVQALRTEMAILRQLQGDFSSDIGGLLTKMKEQTVKVRAIAATEIPAERNFIIAGKSRLDSSSQEVLTLVEDLQDTVDDLKLDVIQRGVKPKPATLKKIAGDIEKATRGLEDLETYVQTVKPSWKKTWESELQNIVDEQEFLNHQEGLLADLRDDHTALQEVYENIQQVVKLRSAGRPTGGKYIPPLPEDGHEGLSTVMLEVRGQSIDHERRLRALQAAEKSRQRELSSRTDEFTEELAGFVSGKAGEGLRKTGGHLEAERIRSKRDKATLLAMFGAGGAGGAPAVSTGDVVKPKRLQLGSNSEEEKKVSKAGSERSLDQPATPTSSMARDLSATTVVSTASAPQSEVSVSADRPAEASSAAASQDVAP